MNIREQIDDYLYDIGLTTFERKGIPDAILALPSGLVAVKECETCGGGGSYTDDQTEDPQSGQCRACNATGRIVRDIPIGEALDILQAKTKTDLFLVKGEKVEVKGGA